MLKNKLILMLGLALGGPVYAGQSSHYTLMQLLKKSDIQFRVCNQIGNNKQEACSVTAAATGIYSSPILTGADVQYFYIIYWPATVETPKFDLSCDGVTVNPAAHGAYYIDNGEKTGYVYNYDPSNNLITCQAIS